MKSFSKSHTVVLLDQMVLVLTGTYGVNVYIGMGTWDGMEEGYADGTIDFEGVIEGNIEGSMEGSSVTVGFIDGSSVSRLRDR